MTDETRYQRIAREQRERREAREKAERDRARNLRMISRKYKPRTYQRRIADHVDGFDRDDIGLSPDY